MKTAVWMRILRGRRRPHPGDGRRLLIEFDPSAFERLAPMYMGLVSSLTEMLAGYTDAELEVIERAFADAADRQNAAALALDPAPTDPPDPPDPPDRQSS